MAYGTCRKDADTYYIANGCWYNTFKLPMLNYRDFIAIIEENI